MNEEEIIYTIALRRCRKIGDNYVHKLLSHYSSAKQIWNTPKKEISQALDISIKYLSDIGNEEHIRFAENELKFCEENKIKIITRQSGQLPGWLGECDDAPAIIYCKGMLPTIANFLSIVGTRNITPYGREFVQKFLEKIKDTQHLYTVSGLALGVDAEVHQKSIDYQIKTIAVLAHGFHMMYPSKNKKLAENILERGGCLISEFNSSHKPDREHFIQRNRVIAGISPSTIVVETAFGGGSISTANFANVYNREVYALPGKISDKYSQGCNKLIAQNKARTIFSLSDLIDELGFSAKQKNTVGNLFEQEELPSLTDIQTKILLNIRSKNGITTDDLAISLDVPSKVLMVELLQLEILGVVRCNSSRQYVAS